MWVQGLANTFFSGFLSNSPLTLQRFDLTYGSFAEVAGSTGETFVPYSAVYEVFGQYLVSGRAEDSLGATIGYDIFTYNSDGSVTLFADIAQGVEPSFFDLDSSADILDSEDFIIGISRGVAAIPAVLYSDGTSTLFSNFFSDIDSLANARFVGSFENTTLMIADVDGRTSGQLIQIDSVNEKYTLLGSYDRPVGTAPSLSNVFPVEDRLFAQINTSAYGRELWELQDDSTWSLVADHAPGRAYGSPSYAFTHGGVHYFTAVNSTFGRELFSLGETGFTLVYDFAPGPANGATPLRTFQLGDSVYLHPGFEASYFRMDEDGTLTSVSGMLPDESLAWPDVIINMDTQTYHEYLGASRLQPAYVIENGEARLIDLPGPNAQIKGFHGGSLYVATKNDDHDLTLYALGTSGDWVEIFHAPYSGSGVPLPRVNDVFSADIHDTGDVWLGNDTSETVVSLDTGGIVFARGGNDLLVGGASGDALLAGDGNDTLEGGQGADLLSGDTGDDIIRITSVETFSAGYRAHNISSPYQTGTGAYVSVEGLVRQEAVIDGGTGFDILNLTDISDALFLHDSFSSFFETVALAADSDGSLGAARLNGIEVINGGAGNDVIDLTSPDYSLDGFSIQINGGVGNDVIWGSDADEHISGSSGDDTIFGGTGVDVLSGGAGADAFEFTRSSTQSEITDFDVLEGDTLRFYNAGDAVFDLSSLEISNGVVTISFSDLADETMHTIRIELDSAPDILDLTNSVEII
ncbi:MAG: hypothetical protein JXR13_00170 [Thalassovita sp.]